MTTDDLSAESAIVDAMMGGDAESAANYAVAHRMVCSDIFCKVSGRVLDVRRAVALVDARGNVILVVADQAAVAEGMAKLARYGASAAFTGSAWVPMSELRARAKAVIS